MRSEIAKENESNAKKKPGNIISALGVNGNSKNSTFLYLTEAESKFSVLFVTEGAKRKAIREDFEFRLANYRALHKQWKKEVDDLYKKYDSALESEETQKLIPLPPEPKFNVLGHPSEMKKMILLTASKVKEEIQTRLNIIK